MRLKGFICIALIALCGCAAKDVPAYNEKAEFSAVLSVEDAGGPIENRIFRAPDKYRLELLAPGGGVTIVRFDKRVVWTLLPKRKAYGERPLTPADRNPLVEPPDEVSVYKKLGADSVEGHPALVERIEMEVTGGPSMEVNRWFATDVKWPLRAEASDGSWRLSLRDFKAGPQDPALFDVPAGYVRM